MNHLIYPKQLKREGEKGLAQRPHSEWAVGGARNRSQRPFCEIWDGDTAAS